MKGSTPLEVQFAEYRIPVDEKLAHPAVDVAREIAPVVPSIAKAFDVVVAVPATVVVVR